LKRQHKKSHGLLLALLVPIFLASCQSVGFYEPPVPGDLEPVQRKLVQGAHRLRGARRISVRGRNFPADCTGTVLALYWYAGIDLSSPLADYQGNGVARLYHFLEDAGMLHQSSNPAPGDIIFWDNTYDRNNDGKPNDYLTHTGMVVETKADGTIVYVHHNYRKGVVFARMNLQRPDVYTEEVGGEVRIVNSPMRMRGSPEYHSWLASQLIRDFGQAWLAF